MAAFCNLRIFAKFYRRNNLANQKVINFLV